MNSYEYIDDEPGNGPIQSVDELYAFRHLLNERGGEVFYESCLGLYAYTAFEPERWQQLTSQQQLVQQAYSKQIHLRELNSMRVEQL